MTNIETYIHLGLNVLVYYSTDNVSFNEVGTATFFDSNFFDLIFLPIFFGFYSFRALVTFSTESDNNCQCKYTMTTLFRGGFIIKNKLGLSCAKLSLA